MVPLIEASLGLLDDGPVRGLLTSVMASLGCDERRQISAGRAAVQIQVCLLWLERHGEAA